MPFKLPNDIMRQSYGQYLMLRNGYLEFYFRQFYFLNPKNLTHRSQVRKTSIFQTISRKSPERIEIEVCPWGIFNLDYHTILSASLFYVNSLKLYGFRKFMIHSGFEDFQIRIGPLKGRSRMEETRLRFTNSQTKCASLPKQLIYYKQLILLKLN